MAKDCFVIMPFGKNKEEKEFYTGVYESIILPAASKMGYNTNRVDTKPSNIGNITKNIVTDLIEDEIVIADMTNGNANVFYELGIRHALHKCKTVLIIQEGYDIPFDLKQHVSVFYSTNLHGIQAAIKGISDAIIRCENAQEGDADNPVHEFFPSLKYLTSSQHEDVLQKQLASLSERNAELQSIINGLGIDVNHTSEEFDILKALDEADNLIKIGGVSALLELRQYMNQKDIDGFLEKLKEVMQSELLTKQNYIDISIMCDSLKLIPHRTIVLQKAHKIFSNDSDIVGRLADAYSDYPTPEYKQKGRKLVEKHISIEYYNEKPIITKKSIVDAPSLMGLFNIYIAQNDWHSIISVCDSALKLGFDEPIFARNKGRALVEMGDFEEAEISVQNAISLEPDNDGLRALLSEIYKKQGNYEKALIESEKAIFLDPDDPNNYINVTIDILNNGYLRDQSGNITGPIDRKKRLKECLPIFSFVLDKFDTPPVRDYISDILSRRNAQKDAILAATTGTLKCENGSFELEYLLDNIKAD